jgi:membrane associated rhomboid family serine protease
MSLGHDVAVVLITLLVFAFVAYRVTTASERAHFAKQVRIWLHRGAIAVSEWYGDHASFFDGLRARQRFAPVTTTIVLVNVIMFGTVLVAGAFAGHDVLVAWGASIGPRTTNGEWWRLVTSLFVHAGVVHLTACLVGLIPVGLVFERFVGSAAVATVYLASGVLAGLMNVSAFPMALSTGASGAICGLYGLACVTAMRGLVQTPRLTIPWGVVKWLACAALVFFVYNAATGIVETRAEVAGLFVGVLCGVAIGKGVSTRTVPVKRSSAFAAAAAVLAIVAAVPLQGITDARPDIDRMRATDDRTAALFRTTARKLAVGRSSEKALIDLIEREIVPALQREQESLVATRIVPDDQKPLLGTAREYVRLRIDAWRMRASAFRKGSLSLLRQADKQEGAARDVLTKIPYPLSPQ